MLEFHQRQRERERSRIEIPLEEVPPKGRDSRWLIGYLNGWESEYIWEQVPKHLMSTYHTWYESVGCTLYSKSRGVRSCARKLSSLCGFTPPLFFSTFHVVFYTLHGDATRPVWGIPSLSACFTNNGILALCRGQTPFLFAIEEEYEDPFA